MSTSATPESTLLEHDGKRYPGGKNLDGLYQFLLDRQALHTVYIEPCVGSGALLRRKIPALKTFAIDANPNVVAWWLEQQWPGVDVVCGCGIDWVEQNEDRLDEDCLIYWDPTYLPETRTRKRIYGVYEMTRQTHERLLAVAKATPARVMLSGYPSKLYDDALSDWHRDETEVITRGRTMRTEVIWMNYDPAACGPPVRPYIGDDFRERERIKRQQWRWCRRLVGLPPGERRAILLEMIGASRRVESKSARLPDPALKATILSTLDFRGPTEEFRLWREVQKIYVRAEVPLDDRDWDVTIAELKADGLVSVVASSDLTTVLATRKAKETPEESDAQLLLFE